MDLLREQDVREIHIAGHSMGGAMALAYAGRSPELLKSITLLAPAVSGSEVTELNQTVVLDSPDGKERMEKLARQLPDVDILTLVGTVDRIVPAADMDGMMSALNERHGITGLGRIEKGTHVGFGDTLDVDVPLFWSLDRILFKIIDSVVYGPGDVLMLDTKEQLETTKKVLSVWFAKVGAPDVVENVQQVSTEEVIKYVWQGDRKSGDGVQQEVDTPVPVKGPQ